jgi:hypothetical protein
LQVDARSIVVCDMPGLTAILESSA